MNRFFLLLVLCVGFEFQVSSQNIVEEIPDSVLINVDSVLDSLNKPNETIVEVPVVIPDSRTIMQEIEMILRNKPLVTIDTLLSENNFLFLPLVLRKLPLEFDYSYILNQKSLYKQPKHRSDMSDNYQTIHRLNDMEFLQKFRLNALRYLVVNAPYLIVYTADELPSVEDIRSSRIDKNYYEQIKVADDKPFGANAQKKIVLEKASLGPWTHKANAYLQFSQYYVSKNWHQGGADNLAILGTVNGKLNYDNKKGIQWENSAEWRAGFNSIEGDTTRLLNTNDDIFRINSKLGVKAGGDFFYSSAFDFSMPVFPTFKAVNSTTLKADFMTPVRVNLSVGLDYKYKKLFSVMLSPIAYKYIYLNNPKVDPKLFGIKAGEQKLKEIGSSFRFQGNYAPTKEMTFDTRLTFYTNYTKVEIDWEMIGNFQVNRFLSTRIILNPRYDSTQILASGEKAKIQFKEMLTFGLSYRLLN